MRSKLFVACSALVVAAVMGIAGTAPVRAAGIAVEGAWARAAAPSAPAGAAYMVLKNDTDSEDRLMAADSDVAEAVQLHTHIEQDGVMMMRPIEFIPVPAGASVALQPGGLHIMLIRLTRPLNEGDQVPLTLTFEHAGEMTIEVPVRSEAP